MRVQYLIAFLICGIFIGEVHAMSPGQGGAPRRVGGGGVTSRGAALVSPGLPCNDIKDEKNFVICFSAKIIEVLPSWVAGKQITDDQSKWIQNNLKPLLDQVQVEGKLKDYKYIYDLILKKANKDGKFTEKSVIGPKVGTIVLIFIVEQIKDSMQGGAISIGPLNPDEDHLIKFAKDYLNVHLKFPEPRERIPFGDRRPEPPSGGGAGPRTGAEGDVPRPGINPPRPMMNPVGGRIYSGW